MYPNEFKIPGPKKYRADGYLEIDGRRVIFKFNGCYFHGCYC